MTAALGTLPFLATLWLLLVLGAKVLEESGAKIAAALKGRPHHRRATNAASLRVRVRYGRQAMRAWPSLRAAA
jgi:hypothetical protein